jgi:hypothetical protein
MVQSTGIPHVTSRAAGFLGMAIGFVCTINAMRLWYRWFAFGIFADPTISLHDQCSKSLVQMVQHISTLYREVEKEGVYKQWPGRPPLCRRVRGLDFERGVPTVPNG